MLIDDAVKLGLIEDPSPVPIIRAASIRKKAKIRFKEDENLGEERDEEVGEKEEVGIKESSKRSKSRKESKIMPLSSALRRQQSFSPKKRTTRKMLTFKPKISLSIIPNSEAKDILAGNERKSSSRNFFKIGERVDQKQSSTSIKVNDKESTKNQLPQINESSENGGSHNFEFQRGSKKRLTRRQKRMMTMQLMNNKKRIPSINFDLEEENFEKKEEEMSKEDKRKMFKNRFRSMTFQEQRVNNRQKSSKELLIIKEE